MKMQTLPLWKFLRFNRYMVECESITQKAELAQQKCFNRYMVECEFVRNKS
mgnify:FL=1